MIVCLCRGVSERHIEDMVAAGATTVGEVSRACGAATDCGACHHLVARLVEDARNAVCVAGGAEVERHDQVVTPLHSGS
jgi:bacterioferritin-associated ferredoxin